MPRINYQKTLRNLGRRIGELRAKTGQTQSQFSEKIGHGHSWLQQIETGHEASLKILIEIANALDCELVELFKAPTSSPPTRGRPAGKRPSHKQ